VYAVLAAVDRTCAGFETDAPKVKASTPALCVKPHRREAAEVEAVLAAVELFCRYGVRILGSNCVLHTHRAEAEAAEVEAVLAAVDRCPPDQQQMYYMQGTPVGRSRVVSIHRVQNRRELLVPKEMSFCSPHVVSFAHFACPPS